MTDSATPTISRVLDDGTLIELVYDPHARGTALAVRHADGTISLEQSYTDHAGDRLVPYSPKNNLIASACVLLPSDIGAFGDARDVLDAVRTHLHRYVDLSPAFEELAAYYILLTWVYDRFTDLPYLRLRGDYGSGKTRGLLVIGSLCYKSFFASGASTISPIFHIQDAFQGTLILDEADFRFSDQTAELVKVLNNGTTDGLPVLRTMTNRHRELNPTAFRVFGPKIVAMREGFSDRALESRFLTEETGGRPLRGDVPIHLPAAFKIEALALRNRLLTWRFHARATVGPEPLRVPAILSPRRRQAALALLSIMDDEEARSRLCHYLVGEDDRARGEVGQTFEALMVAAIDEAFAATPAAAALGDVARCFNARAEGELRQVVSNRWVGGFVRRRLRLATFKTGGVYVIPATERPRITALAKRYGVEEAA